MGYPTFNVGEVLTASDMNAVGLWKITPTVSGSGMSVSGNEVVLTNVSNGEIRSVFSSAYRNYRVVLNHSCSTTVSVNLEMLSGTNTPETGAVYRWGAVGYISVNATYNDAATATTSFAGFSQGAVSDAGSAHTIAEFAQPNVASRTWIKTSNGFEWTSNTVYMREYNVLVDTATQYTGFRLLTSTGTITGTINIYGWK